MTEHEVLELIWGATIPPEKWVENIRTKPTYAWRNTKYGKALLAARAMGQHPAPPPPPPPPPNTIPPAFRGRGMLATWNTEAVWRPLAPYLDWIALLGRLPDTTMGLADAIRATGPRVLVWEDENSNDGIGAVRRINASGYIGQGESAAQRAAKVRLGADLDANGIAKGLVDNLDPASGGWPGGWTCFPEVYEAANPNATLANMLFEARQRGAVMIVPCYQLYVEGDQHPVFLDQYHAEAVPLGIGKANWVGYSLLTEAERARDVTYLKSLGPVR